jgi:hypothetical protein
MEIHGEMCDCMPQIQDNIHDFFIGLFGVEEPKYVYLQSDFWDPVYCLSVEDKLLLEPSFAESELRKTIFDSDASGAPGLNGFSFLFYQHFFDLMKHDMLLVLYHFYSHSLNVAQLNHAMIYLIPKEQDARVIQKYIAINLVDYCYKIILEILTNRLQHLMNSLVDTTQLAFFKDRYIMDNVMTVHEIIYYAIKHK